MANLIPPIPNGKIEEGHLWREWFFNLGTYIQVAQVGGAPWTVPQGGTGLSTVSGYLKGAGATIAGVGQIPTADVVNLSNTNTGDNATNTQYSGLAASKADLAGNIAQAFSVSTLRTTGYTVATLPAGTIGMRAYVTDATLPTYLGALTGGGAVKCPVFYNGTAWVSA